MVPAYQTSASISADHSLSPAKADDTPASSKGVYAALQSQEFAANVDAGEPANGGNKYGVRARDWQRYYNGKTPLSKSLHNHAEALAERLTAVAKQRRLPFGFTGYELATNFIAEGGFFMRNLNLDTGFQYEWDGYQELGADMFIQYRDKLMPWLSPELTTLSAYGARHKQIRNEQNQWVSYMNGPTLALALEMNGVMFAESKEAFYLACKAQKIPFASLSDTEVFFWSSLFFNMQHNRKGADARLSEKGVGWANTPFTGTDDHDESKMSPKFNATWRTATYELQSNREHYVAAAAEPESLTIESFYDVSNLPTSLANYDQLDTLTINHPAITNLDAFVRFETLQRIEVIDGHITDVSALVGMSRLSSLIIENSKDIQIADLRPLENLRALKYLKIGSSVPGLELLRFVGVRPDVSAM